ncbi:hypothetical protein CFter6_4556 [Collimonas fungivorans]|uniref:Uncharacterized protein n=1 Tax=Collimonas fungivorans TaxID=158899 RepID=A0A127PH60_9BURK|nr:hypothetical protein CFter6_4556 [Collimonas fungivorans]
MTHKPLGAACAVYANQAAKPDPCFFQGQPTINTIFFFDNTHLT